MKSHLSFFAITSLLFATAWTSPGYQGNATNDVKSVTVIGKQSVVFSFFRTHRQGKNVAASWATESEEGIVGFQVLRTYEDPTDPYAIWDVISNVSANGSRSYDATDNDVLPGILTYKVVAQNADGTTVESDLSQITIVSH